MEQAIHTMYQLDFLLAIILFSFTAAVTPGPNNIMIMSSGLNFGIKSSLPHLLGICLGFPTMVLIIGVGMGALLEAFPMIHQIIQILGAAYMLFLAYKIAISHLKINKNNPTKPLTFIQACLFQWVNPKAWVMGVGAIAAYTTPGSHIFSQVCLISFIFFLVGIPSAAIWLFFGSSLNLFLKSDKHRLYFNLTMSALLVLSIALIFIE